MGYEIDHLRIEEDSVEGRNLQAIIERENVTPEEAIRRVLRGLPGARPSPAEELIGMFSEEGDPKLMDEVMALARERRERDVPRDFGL